MQMPRVYVCANTGNTPTQWFKFGKRVHVQKACVDRGDKPPSYNSLFMRRQDSSIRRILASSSENVGKVVRFQCYALFAFPILIDCCDFF